MRGEDWTALAVIAWICVAGALTLIYGMFVWNDKDRSESDAALVILLWPVILALVILLAPFTTAHASWVLLRDWYRKTTMGGK